MEPGFKPPCPSGLITLAIILVAPSKLSWLHEWMNECTNYKHLNWEAWLNENMSSPKKLTVFISLGLCFSNRERAECSHWLRDCCVPGTVYPVALVVICSVQSGCHVNLGCTGSGGQGGNLREHTGSWGLSLGSSAILWEPCLWLAVLPARVP